jgi:hypothetical protein
VLQVDIIGAGQGDKDGSVAKARLDNPLFLTYDEVRNAVVFTDQANSKVSVSHGDTQELLLK